MRMLSSPIRGCVGGAEGHLPGNITPPTRAHHKKNRLRRVCIADVEDQLMENFTGTKHVEWSSN